MPEWLQTVLIVAAILLVAYLIAIAVQVILAQVLRRQNQPMRESLQRAQHDLASLRAQLEQLAPEINAGPSEMPFGPLYDQARDLLKKGLSSADDLQSRAAAVAGQQIGEQPLARSLLLVPVSREVTQRLAARTQVKTATVQLTEVNEALTRIRHIQSDIDALPAREKVVIDQLRSRAVQAGRAIDAETRAERPMSAERAALERANGLIDESTRLLADPKPAQTAVIVAYPLRVQAEEHLTEVDRAVTAVRDRRKEAELALEKATTQLGIHDRVISGDESAGLPRPAFRARSGDLRARLEAARAQIDRGDYDGATRDLTALSQDIEAQRMALARVTRARETVAGLAVVADERATTVEQWAAQAPAPVDPDVTRGALQQLRDIAERLHSLAPAEDADAMEAAADLGRQADEVFARASRVHEDAVAGQRRHAELTRTLNDAGVASMVATARQVAAELSQAHPSYWRELTPGAINAAADDLAQQWQALSPSLAVIPESEMPEVLARAEGVQATYARTGDLHAQAIRALTQVDADRLQADTALNDTMVGRLLDEADAIGQSSPAFAEPPRRIRARIEELRAEMAQPAPDYHTINANALRLRREAETFVADHEQRLQHVLSHLGEIGATIRQDAASLQALADETHIDFGAEVTPLAQRARAWLSRYDGAAVPLDVAQAALSEGEAIARDADAVVGECQAVRDALNEQQAAGRAALDDLDAWLAQARADLDALAGVGAKRWGPDMLAYPASMAAELRAELERIERGPGKLAPAQARGAVDALARSVSRARERAAHAQADVANNVAEISRRRAQLTQACVRAEALAREHPEFRPEWEALRGRIAVLEGRAAEASSYGEALDALTQAVQRTEAFAASAQAQI